MEVTGRLYPPVALPPGKQFLIIVDCEGVWAPELMWAIGRESVFVVVSQTVCALLSSLQPSRFTDWAIPHQKTHMWRGRIIVASEISCLSSRFVCHCRVSYIARVFSVLFTTCLLFCVLSACTAGIGTLFNILVDTEVGIPLSLWSLKKKRQKW